MPSHDYDTKNIVLKLRFDWEHEQALGTETITLSPLVADLRKIELDAAIMTINSVTLASGASLKFEMDGAQEKLRIMLDRGYQLNEALDIVIDYHTNGTVSDRGIFSFGRGLTFIKPTADDPTRPRQLWSQGESEYNHYWFPCYDHPNDFATSELIATVDKPLMVISNGKLLSTRDNGDNTRTYDWKIDQPHASYLTSIVVGDYAAVESDYAGIPVTSYVYPTELIEGRVSTGRLPEMVKFFSEKTGLKYPYAKYSQTMVRDFGGGMENISATTQTDNMIHDARTELDQTSDSLQSHELAHQWFGDYVTARSWADIWLNESFATYFQAMWDEHSLGRDDFLYLDVKGNQDRYLNTWNQGIRRPIVTQNYANPDAVFDTYAYPRGGAVLHMLRTYLGEDNWWRAINHYLTKYAHQPVGTEQFRIAIEEATGQSMDWFFDEWLYRMGHPVFEITKAYDANEKKLTLTLKQTQKPDPNSQYPQVKLFQTPVDIEIVTASGPRIERVWIEPKEEQTSVFVVDSEPVIVDFDYGDTLIKEIEFKKTVAELVYQLAHDQDMMGRLWALGQLANRLHAETTAAKEQETIKIALAERVKQDKFWGMRLESATALTKSGELTRSALLEATKDQNALVRAAAITSLSTLKDPSLATVYKESLNDQSYGVIRAAAAALGETRSPGAYEALVALLEVPSWRHAIRSSALGGLTALGDKRALDLGLRYAARDNPAQVRGLAFQLVATIGRDDPRAFTLLADALVQAFDKRDFPLVNASADALVTLGDARGVAVFGGLQRKASDAPQFRSALIRFQERLESRKNNR